MSVTVNVDAVKRKLDEWARELEAETGNAMSDALAAAEGAAVTAIQAQTKRHTGKLLDQTQVVQLSATRGKLFSLAPYARFIDEGTRPHTIRASGSKTLSFVVNGRRIFRRSVDHPGTKARPFVSPARLLGERALEMSLRHRVDALNDRFWR